MKELHKKLTASGLVLLCLLTLQLQLFTARDAQATTEAQVADIASLSFVDQHNKPFSLQDFHGKTVVLHFAFTGCSVYCPIQISQLSNVFDELQDKLDRDKFEFVSITLTPLTDNAESMRRFAERFSIDEKNWRFATGEQHAVDAMVEMLSAKVIQTSIPGEVDHTTDIYVINANGQLRSTHQGVPVDKQSIIDDLLKLTLAAAN